LEQLRSAAAVVALVSPAWAESRSCLRELELVRELKLELIAVKVAPVDRSTVAKQLLRAVHAAVWQQETGKKQIRARVAELDLLEEFFQYVPGRSPYPGLAGFDEEDAAVFFGRSAQIAEAIDRLRSFHEAGGCHVLVILGASGSGKSSFLRAGLWARLRRD